MVSFLFTKAEAMKQKMKALMDACVAFNDECAKADKITGHRKFTRNDQVPDLVTHLDEQGVFSTKKKPSKKTPPPSDDEAEEEEPIVLKKKPQPPLRKEEKACASYEDIDAVLELLGDMTLNATQKLYLVAKVATR